MDSPTTYRVRLPFSDEVAEIQASSPEEAAREFATEFTDKVRLSTQWFSVYVDDQAVRLEIHPEEPDCLAPDHDWDLESQAGHGGGVIIRERCVYCGCGRTIDTWAHNPDTGESGLRAVSYYPRGR